MTFAEPEGDLGVTNSIPRVTGVVLTSVGIDDLLKVSCGPFVVIVFTVVALRRENVS